MTTWCLHFAGLIYFSPFWAISSFASGNAKATTNTSGTQFTKLVPCKKPTPVTDRDASITEASP